MKITLQDEIEAAETVVAMYRNSWFMPINVRKWNGKLRWAGEPEQWREWLAANAILRRLKRLRLQIKRREAKMTKLRDTVASRRKRRVSRN